jgi:hypothetical protein
MMPPAKEAGMKRTKAAMDGLRAEAEQLVRSGVSRAEVTRRLALHPQTLATWALLGGWRQKDLAAPDRRDVLQRVVDVVAARGREAVEAVEWEAARKLLARRRGGGPEYIALMDLFEPEKMAAIRAALAELAARRALEAAAGSAQGGAGETEERTDG